MEVRHWTARGAKKPADGKECFSLIFENAGPEQLTQDTYTVAHSSLGEFLTVLGAGSQNGEKYEALFNRLARLALFGRDPRFS